MDLDLLATVDKWTCNANGAVQVSMVQPGADGKLATLSTFQPQFTYPIFGDEERIFGYDGLMIRLRFAAHNLSSNIVISYDRRFQTVDDVSAVDLNGALRPFLPDATFRLPGEFEAELMGDAGAKDWSPPGELVHSYRIGERSFEVWAGSLVDRGVRQLLERMQIFISFFIEGGTPIETNDLPWTLQRWTVHFLYEKMAEPSTPTASPYLLAGYCTTYRPYVYQIDNAADKPTLPSDAPFPYTEHPTISQQPARLRISQFLILPPHQQAGHGSHLYRLIQSRALEDPTVLELTVEDPNEAFDALRDVNDYTLLRPEFERAGVAINPDPYQPGTTAARRPSSLVPTAALLPVQTLDRLRAQFKIAPVQFAHMVEAYLLSTIPAAHRSTGGANMTRLLLHKWRAPDPHDRCYYWWRLLVKQRLYRAHRDLLAQIDQGERVEKLEETVMGVEEGYDERLQEIRRRERRGRSGAEDEDENEEAETASGKGEGEGEGEDEGEASESGIPAKRLRNKRKHMAQDDEGDDDTESGGGDVDADGVQGGKRLRKGE